MRYILVLLISLAFVGCSTKQSRYILPEPYTPVIHTTKVQVGVKKVKVPSYLNNDKIVVKNGLKVEELEANFASSPDKLFTHQAIATLKKALNDPNVFLYPWDVKSKKGYIVDIVLDNFIYSDGEVTLSGSYFIKMANGATVSSKNFSYKASSTKDPNDIIENLGSLFNKVVLEIAQKIAR